MAYKALYRKYRPDTFEGVVGQKHIIQTIQNAINNNKVAHAYIFSGPRGTGKTTTAKLLAKALNCLSEEHVPCNECSSCKAINEGTHPDIIEIDAASNNGVDEIRNLIEQVKYAPIEGKYKVYIIDEVHMLTSGAFNALLKTLEEPPEHVVFILATTDVHKVIPTVLSRCQRFDFAKIDLVDIENKVKEILELENIAYEEGVPSLVAELADGGMRDALSILDEVVSYAGNDIKLQHIYDIYGMMSTGEMVSFLTLLAKKQSKDVLNTIENYIGKGIDVKRLTYDLMVCLKDAIVYKQTFDESILEKIDAKNACDILDNYSIEDALQVNDILNEARNNYRLSTNYRLFFELAALKIIDSLGKEKVNYVEKVVERKEEVVVETKPVVKEVSETIIKEEPVIEKTIKEEVITPIVEQVPVKEETIKQDIEETRTVEIPLVNLSDNVYNAPTCESETITYPLEEYVNILSHGDKKYKEDLIARWQNIRKYQDSDNTRYVAQLLSDTTIGAASKDFVLIVCDFKLIASRARQLNNILLIRRFLSDAFDIDSNIYVVDRSLYTEATQKYVQLRQANKLNNLIHELPKMDESIVKQEVIAKQEESTPNNDQQDKTVEVGIGLFGDDLIVK